jgi:hypothetical protein
VVSNFGFLLDSGLRLADQQVTFVRYQSDVAFINVYHGRSSYELGVEIGRIDRPGEQLSVNDIVAWAGAEKAENVDQHTTFQVAHRDGIQRLVARLADLVRKYALPLLDCEQDAYASATNLQSQRGKALENEIRLRGIRREAEVAWSARDYILIVEVYSSMREDLTEVEARRLAYAEKQATPTAAGSLVNKGKQY